MTALRGGLPVILTLQNCNRYGSTGFGIGQGVVVMLQVVAAGGRYGVQLVVG